jgi:propanol-preferring alcohol dehydrogenase
MAIQIRKALTPATIVALDTTDERLALAKELGAEETFLSSREVVKNVRDMTGGSAGKYRSKHRFYYLKRK